MTGRNGGLLLAGGLVLLVFVVLGVGGYVALPAHTPDIDHEYGRAVGPMFMPLIGFSVVAGVTWARGLRRVGVAFGTLVALACTAFMAAALHGRF